ncbi:GIY-YIG nuclease family protein [Salsuginibacillus kocurii]|uniref:GIY-YIG nuclease family protein n=1 Tax=Salsuginibacillus kocurii TaxID=427078 RepID=UPI000369EA4E|nr:GIY-YIG nuclease family protein [Salsuginibacillus kocurii]
MKEKTEHYVYILECCDGSYYTGYTTDPTRRFHVHESGKGAKYTRARRPLALVYTKQYATKQDAMREEYAIKQLTRTQKEHLVYSGGKRDASSVARPSQ